MASNKENFWEKNYGYIRIIAVILMIVGLILFMGVPMSTFGDFSVGIFEILPYVFAGMFLFAFSGILLNVARRKKLTESGHYAFGVPEEKRGEVGETSQRIPRSDTTPRNMVTCETCGTKNKRDAKFCNNCGEAL